MVGPLHDVALALRLAFWPTLARIATSPSLLLDPAAVSRMFMSHVWSQFGPAIDQHSAQLRAALITRDACGVVLDLGAGYGHAAKYLDPARVTRYVALEPNPCMHDDIRRAALAAGFSEAAGSFLLLSCGAEDTTAILTRLGGYQPVDTLLSLLTLCSVPEPRDTISSLVTDVLKPGGQILFFEHVQSPLSHVAWWQAFWSPLWGLAFGGCRMNRPTHTWIHQAAPWASERVDGVDGEDDHHLFMHRVGKCVKAA